ncbi:hypothetical protein KKI23_02365 [Patescibacteria group bacterium]|nr:hypothetical protein [Patescibacteria group bacterium]
MPIKKAPTNNKNKNLLILLIVLAIVIAGTLGYYFAFIYQGETKICLEDEDCRGTCSCGCIHVDETCPSDRGQNCFYQPDCECQEGTCQEKITANSVPDCQLDNDCYGTCTCGCLHINETCPTDADVLCESVPDCQCEDGNCEEITEDNIVLNVNANTNQADAETVTTTTEFTETGNLTGEATSGFSLLYEEPGNPALTVSLNFDYPSYTSSCTIDGVPMTCQQAMDQDLLTAGDLVTVTGTEVDTGEIAVTMLDN